MDAEERTKSRSSVFFGFFSPSGGFFKGFSKGFTRTVHIGKEAISMSQEIAVKVRKRKRKEERKADVTDQGFC